jgi:DNA-binding HxlR family transcriptional regulator
VHEAAAAEQPQPRSHSQRIELARALSATGDRWTLLIALALAGRPRRPVELRQGLPGISAGVLDRHLQQMVALGLLLRSRFKEMPPRVELALTEAGRELLPIARALARWGAKHM